MTEARGRAGVVLVPELHELPSLFLPDPERARRAGRLIHWLLRERPDVPCESGAGGHTAEESAQWLVEAGCTRALVVPARSEPDGEAERFVELVLLQALRRANLSVEVAATDEDPVPWIAERLGPLESLRAPWTLLPPHVLGDEERSGHGPARDGLLDGWAGGTERSASRSLHALRILPVADWNRHLAHGASLIAFTGWARRVRATVAAARDVGPERCRLVGPPRGLEEWRSLHEIVAEAFPHLVPELSLVLRWRDQDVRPLHELYAGRGLSECNARLVENLQ